METIEYDIRGQLCPSTLLVALREINTHAAALWAGTHRICFLIDNRDATITIPESAINMGYRVGVEKKDGCYRIEISYKKI